MKRGEAMTESKQSESELLGASLDIVSELKSQL